MLVERTLLEVKDRVADAIDILQAMEPDEGYHLAFSGGKDSVVILDLAKRAGVRFRATYNVTTVDPPELYNFIRDYHPEVARLHPGTTMWRGIAKNNSLPTRIARWCCRELKERSLGAGLVVTGIRAGESYQRSSRCMTERDRRDPTVDYLHPIIEWSDTDVWEYIRANSIPYCSLYDEGWKRLGCVMCPMGGEAQRRQQMKRWPSIARAYKRAAVKAYESRKDRGDEMTWESGEAYFEWWLSDRRGENSEQQRFVFD